MNKIRSVEILELLTWPAAPSHFEEAQAGSVPPGASDTGFDTAGGGRWGTLLAKRLHFPAKHHPKGKMHQTVNDCYRTEK